MPVSNAEAGGSFAGKGSRVLTLRIQDSNPQKGALKVVFLLPERKMFCS